MRLIRENQFVLQTDPDLAIEECFYQLLMQMKELPESDVYKMMVRLLDLTQYLLQLGRALESRQDSGMVETACSYLGRHATERIDLKQFCKANSWGYEQFRKRFREQVSVAPGHTWYCIRREWSLSAPVMFDVTMALCS